MYRQFLTSIWQHKRIIAVWTRYNIQANLLNTKLGMIWLVLYPLLMTLVYSFLFSFLLNRSPRGGVPFIAFFLSGMIVWIFFNNSLFRSTTLIVQNANLIEQVQFPRETLIYVFVGEQAVDFSVSFVILLVLSFISGYYPTWAYIYIPPILLTLFLMVLGSVFILATLGLFVRDIPKVLNLILRFLFYGSGIIFPADVLPPKALEILVFNPVFFLVESFRNILFYAETPDLLSLVIWFFLSVFVAFIGFSIFKAKSGVFADYR